MLINKLALSRDILQEKEKDYNFNVKLLLMQTM